MDGVPSLWERRYNLSSADSSLAPDPPYPSRRENPLIRCLATPYGLALPPFPPALVVLLPRLLRRLVLSYFLALPAGFFFFFGSATVPLAARESPLTRRMDDLRISSRSLSLVRSRYRRRPLPPRLPPPVFFLRTFPTLPLFLPVRRLSFPPSPRARVPPPYRSRASLSFVSRDATRALTKESSARVRRPGK